MDGVGAAADERVYDRGRASTAGWDMVLAPRRPLYGRQGGWLLETGVGGQRRAWGQVSSPALQPKHLLRLSRRNRCFGVVHRASAGSVNLVLAACTREDLDEGVPKLVWDS